MVKAIDTESSPVLLEAVEDVGTERHRVYPVPNQLIAYLQASRSPVCQEKPLLSGKLGDCLGGFQFLEMQRSVFVFFRRT